MKKLLFALLFLASPVFAQTQTQYYTVPTIAALKAMTTSRPAVVQVVDANPGIFNLSAGACSAADDIFQVQPTSGTTVCYTRLATPYSVGKSATANGVLVTSAGGVPSISTTLPAVSASAATTTATGATTAISLANRAAQTFKPQDFATSANIAADASTAINACLTAAAAASGGVCEIPQKGSEYLIGSGITIPANASLTCGGDNIVLRASAAITDFVKFTSNIYSSLSNCILAEAGGSEGRSTNGVVFDPVAFGNNRLTVDNVKVYGFQNNYYNRNADYFTIINSWSQGATVNTLRSVKSATGSLISNMKSLGDYNGMYFSPGGGFTTEGVQIVNSQLLNLRSGSYAIKFDQSLLANITDTVTQGSIIFDGTTTAHSNVNLKGVYVSAATSNTVGVDFIGNVSDLNIDGLTVGAVDGCGLRFITTAALGFQRGTVRGYRGAANGTSAGSADLCINTAAGSGVQRLSIGGSWFTSTGGSVKSVLETAGGTIQVTYEPSNTYASTSTIVQTNAVPVSGGVPYVNSSLFQSYSAALAANSLVIGGGAGAAPATTTTGTGIVTALGVNVGTAGSVVVNGGALGTPSSGVGTNITGVNAATLGGATFAAPGPIGNGTPSTGAFTTLSSTLANTATTSAVCYNTGTGLFTYNSTVGTCTVSALAYKNPGATIANGKVLASFASLRTDGWTYKKLSGLDDREHVGLYADDVAKLDKRCAIYKDGKIENYDDRCVLAYTIAAMKELKAGNDNLKTEIEQLKKKVK